MADTWREAAGRAHGDDGYQFGDISRSLVRRGSLKAQQWAAQPKQRDGYEFGDLMAAVVRRLSGSGDALEAPAAEEAASAGAPATTEHEEIAERLTKTRQEARELLEENLPLLAARLADLEGRTVTTLSAWERSAMLRLQGGGGGRPSPLLKYEKVLEEVKQSMQMRPTISAVLVRQLASSGRMAIIEQPLLDVLRAAKECASCARDVGDVAAAGA